MTHKHCVEYDVPDPIEEGAYIIEREYFNNLNIALDFCSRLDSFRLITF